MTLPREDRDLLMFLASSSTAPSAPVLLTWEDRDRQGPSGNLTMFISLDKQIRQLGKETLWDMYIYSEINLERGGGLKESAAEANERERERG